MSNPQSSSPHRPLQTSPFLALPNELILSIANHLYTNPLLALRSSCILFYAVLPNPYRAPGISHYNRNYIQRTYAEYLRAIQVKAFRASLVADSCPDGELLCSNCLAAHPTAWFSEIEQGVAPEERGCRGTEGVVELLNGCRVNFREVKRIQGAKMGFKPWGVGTLQTREWAEDKRDGIWGSMVRRRPRVAGGIRERGCFVGGPGEVFEEREEGEVEVVVEGKRGEDMVIRRECVIAQVDSTLEISHADLFSHTGAIGRSMTNVRFRAGGFCPHLRIHLVWKMLQTPPYKDCPHVHTHGPNPQACTPPHQKHQDEASTFRHPLDQRKPTIYAKCGGRYICPNPVCQTYFFIYRARLPFPASLEMFPQHEGGTDELILTIMRNFGPMEEPNDPRWIVQSLGKEPKWPRRNSVEPLIGNMEMEGFLNLFGGVGKWAEEKESWITREVGNERIGGGDSEGIGEIVGGVETMEV
ncbi:hypothetical protein P154DRAFT_576652 [Amniculicola lignicola CBS 123094]|uniref:F-box domain-containing protein n=1 Tax=Amniculicola lignicola CBS 123094 TaxID=1392246 RepID=A0A6A5WQ70_9PLEO|nr:hypothetical protein P154DRAFT_576652 [Amniculicola lignicola CBS 123094]